VANLARAELARILTQRLSNERCGRRIEPIQPLTEQDIPGVRYGKTIQPVSVAPLDLIARTMRQQPSAEIFTTSATPADRTCHSGSAA
jgi:hypothetical protein